MRYWFHVIHRAGSDTLDYFMQGGYMTGVAIFLILSCLVAIFRGKYKAKELIVDGIFGAIAVLIYFGIYFVVHVLYFSPSAIYWEQNGIISDQTNSIIKIQKQLDDKSAKLGGFIDQQIVANENGTTNSLIFLQVSVSNDGLTPSVADYYKLNVILTNNESVLAKPIDFTDSYSWNVLRSNTLTIYKLERSELISEKTGTPIQPGAEPRGWLAYRLPGFQIGSFRQTNFSFIVSFYDAGDNQVFVTNGFRPFGKGRASEFEKVEFPKTMRGSENLIYTNISLQIVIDPANWQPPELPPGCSNVSVWFGNQIFTVPRWQAETLPNNSISKIPMSDLPESYTTNLAQNPGYSPRLNTIWIKHGSPQTTFGNQLVDYPFWPYIESNRLFLYVQIPGLSGLQKLVMNDSFDSTLPLPWDRNYATNAYVFEIVNENKNPVLQAFYAKPDEIHLNGIFIVNSNSVLKAFYDAPLLMTMNYKAVDLETKQEITNIDFGDKVISATKTNSFGEIITNALYDLTFTNQRAIFKYPTEGKNIGIFAN
jgi:hypothetical protein